ncbi:MAG TPA: hypothetical protein DCQ06_00695, partial [Myxococcales bacterium]|nr:hypothetical protein [Myxococcales bacterium]
MNASRRWTQLISRLMGAAIVMAMSSGCGPIFMVDPIEHPNYQNTQHHHTAQAQAPAQPAQPAQARPKVRAPVATGQADPRTTFNELSAHGRWIWHRVHGWAWYPYANRQRGWRPYYIGYWDHTSYGWTWVSQEAWGSTPYHYGRWFWSRRHNAWLWKPGYEWAPAWVNWRRGNGYVGWSPMGPRGYRQVATNRWVFVPQGQFYRGSVPQIVVRS